MCLVQDSFKSRICLKFQFPQACRFPNVKLVAKRRSYISIILCGENRIKPGVILLWRPRAGEPRPCISLMDETQPVCLSVCLIQRCMRSEQMRGRLLQRALLISRRRLLLIKPPTAQLAGKETSLCLHDCRVCKCVCVCVCVCVIKPKPYQAKAVNETMRGC